MNNQMMIGHFITRSDVTKYSYCYLVSLVLGVKHTDMFMHDAYMYVHRNSHLYNYGRITIEYIIRKVP